jgi:transcriptional regulator with XRE-family HTH domain
LAKKWTGNLVGLMHDHKISKTDLAVELGVSREYVSMILNEHRKPSGAKEQFEAAVKRLIEKQK